MGHGNNDVGSKTPTRKVSQPNMQMSGGGSSKSRIDQQMQAAIPQNCGEMSQQGSFSFPGHISAPQKLVRLVGCRVPNVAAEPWTRLRDLPEARHVALREGTDQEIGATG